MKAKPALESSIQAEVKRALEAHGCVLFRMNSRVFRVPGKGGQSRLMRAGVKGMSDLIGWAGEEWADAACVFLAVEVKRPGMKLSPEQAAFLALVKQAGGIAFVATSAAEAVAKLKEAR